MRINSTAVVVALVVSLQLLVGGIPNRVPSQSVPAEESAEGAQLRSKANGDDAIEVTGFHGRRTPGVTRKQDGGAVPVAKAPVRRYCPPARYSHGESSVIITDCEGPGGTERPPWLFGGDDGELPEDVVIEPIVVTRSDLQSLLVHSGSLEVQPARSWVLVNAETIVMTDSAEHVLGTQVLGLSVDVRVTPVLFSWDFGDGSAPVIGTDPGAPWPDHTVAHTYRTEGDVVITLRTEWDAVFRVAGTGGWVPVQGRAITQTTSDPIEVVSAIPRLTAGR